MPRSTGENERSASASGTTINRRRLVANMAQSAAVAQPAPGANSDPIFAVLEADARDRKACRAARAALGKLELRWRREIGRTAPPYITMEDGATAAAPEDVARNFRASDPARKHERTMAVYNALLRQRGKTNAAAPARPTDEETRAFGVKVEDAQRRLAAALEKHERAKQTCGLSAAETYYEECLSAAIVAESAVMATCPTTMRGLAALVRYVRNYVESARGEAENILPALENIGAFLSRRNGIA